ncbi:6959_t:CDS:1 [Racocetra persica]|uniref:6959_t:CDS:1 n=1 Tax=Racocetra persica TaxID=160502 RepID=A0ACA9S4H6_9GLOM|nr:6959_t:CDS:1 [Racocetra persica]
MATTKKRKISPCSLGSCGDITAYNVCGQNRLPGSLVDKIDFDAQGLTPIETRFLAFPLLQEPKSFKSLNLLDFSLYIKLVSYHPSTTNTTHQVKNDLISTKLLSPFKIDIYLVRICDLETAKKRILKIEDVLKDPNDIKRHQLKDQFDILMSYSVQISCSTDCVFNDHEIIMCRSFLKEEQKICEISDNDNESTIYNTGNYRIIMVIDYMDWMYQSRIKDDDIAVDDKIDLGDTFERNNSGHPVMISSGSIEVSYHPNLTQVNSIEAFSQMVANRIIDKIPRPAAEVKNDDKDL